MNLNFRNPRLLTILFIYVIEQYEFVFNEISDFFLPRKCEQFKKEGFLTPKIEKNIVKTNFVPARFHKRSSTLEYGLGGSRYVQSLL